MEFPIEFFLDYAWNPDKWPAERLPEYTQRWAEQQFGAEYSKDIADILTKYTRYNARRKPELLSPDTYSLVNYREAETVVIDYNALAKRARHISDSLAPEYKDAFYQLVLHPVLACSNLNELYVTVGRNRLYANQGRVATNALAEKAKRLFDEDSAITYYYNRVMAGGKWDHMMDQTHIGYTYWQQPDKNSIPDVKGIQIPSAADMGVSIEGLTHWWPKDGTEAVLPEFDPYNQKSYYIEIFNRGKTPFKYSVQSGKPWVKIDKAKGKIETEDRLWIGVDWKKAPSGTHRVPITVDGPNNSRVIVYAVINNPSQPKVSANGTSQPDRWLAGASGGDESRAQSPKWDQAYRFVESNGYVSIEAEHYTQAVNTSPTDWQRIPDLGRTLSGLTPMTVPNQSPGGNSPHLEYRMQIFSKGEVKVRAYLSPTLNFHKDQGLRYAISFDDEPSQIINMHADDSNRNWEEWVSDNINVEVSRHKLEKPGEHVLKFWAVDPGVVLQKIVVETGELGPSYLGPPESFCGAIKYAKGL
jgi:hypothetical protein